MISHLILFSGIVASLADQSLVSKTRKLLDQWEPEDVWERESDYRNDLADFLREELPETYVVEEYGQGRVRKDIRIEDLSNDIIIGIELKYELSSSSEANRLLGQALRYSNEVDVLFVLLINCDPNQIAEIEKYTVLHFDTESVEIISIEFE